MGYAFFRLIEAEKLFGVRMLERCRTVLVMSCWERRRDIDGSISFFYNLVDSNLSLAG